MTFGSRLNWAMAQAGIPTGAELARRTRGLISEQSIRFYLTDQRTPKAAYLRALAKATNVDDVWLEEGTGSPKRVAAEDEPEADDREVIGYVGAGGEAFFEPSSIGTIRLLHTSESTVAVKIRGDSLGHGFDGWYAIYDNVQTPVTERLNGRLCVVGTEDGRTLIKWIYSADEGRHLLVSGSGAVERNVKLSWGAEVLTMQPHSRLR